MKHFLISEVFPPKTGGSGRWFWEVYSRLPREQVAVVAGKCLGDAAFDAEHNLAIVRENLTFPDWGIVGLAKGHRYLSMYRRIRHYATTQQAHSVHCGRCLPEGLLGLALKYRKGLPLLTYVHGEELATAQSSRELTWLTRKVLRGTDLVIANSRNTAQILREEWKIPLERLCVLHPGVDTKRFVPADRMATSSTLVRQRLGWEDRMVILTVGRLQLRKGHDNLIESLKIVRQYVPNVLYAIVGDGDERARLQRLIASEGLEDFVRMHGELQDNELMQCYQQCDLFALPNRQVGTDFEGFGMVLLEAQSCGRPVLAGKSGGTAETMQVPETGQLVNCDRPEPLADALVTLLSNPPRLEAMGKAARKWVVDRFDWKALTEQATDLFAELVESDVYVTNQARAKRIAEHEGILSIPS